MINYAYAQLAVGYNHKFGYFFLDRSKNFVREKNHHNDAIVHVTSDIELDCNVPNMEYYYCDDSYTKKVGNWFAFNLKYLAIKNAVENTDAEFILYTDADFSIAKEYSEEKLQNYLQYLKSEDIDINSYIERCIKGDDVITLTPNEPPWYAKYYRLNVDGLDGEVRMFLESFMAFKNGPKLKEFLKYWEELYHHCNNKGIEHYGECVEIGIAANKSKMNYVPHRHMVPTMIMREMYYMHNMPVGMDDHPTRITFF